MSIDWKHSELKPEIPKQDLEKISVSQQPSQPQEAQITPMQDMTSRLYNPDPNPES